MADENNKDDIVPTERFTPEPTKGPNEDVTSEPPVPLTINGQYIKDFSFESPNTPDVFTLLQNAVPAIQIDIDVQANPKLDNLYEVSLTVRAEAKIEDTLAYLCEVEYAGLFTINVIKEQLGPVLLIECPLILFPFLRRIVADLTGDAGFAPLMLTPIDFASLFQQKMEANQKEVKSQAESGKETVN